MSFPLAVAIVAVAGFISLSYEILWYRAYSFVSAGSPAAFGVVLGVYLAGIALGSLGSRVFCGDRASREDPRHLRSVALFVFGANLLGFLVVPATGWMVTRTGHWGHTLGLVALAAGLLGATLPLVSHFGIAPDDRAGSRLSVLYMGNIVGSAAGSLVTGFVLMDAWSTEGISVLLALLGTGVAAGIFALSRPEPRTLGAGLGLAALASCAVILLSPALFQDVFAKLFWKRKFAAEGGFARVIETRSGVIGVTGGGAVYGGGAYDGVFNTDLVHDSNLIIRPYAISALHPSPRQVLMVGLSSGSWAQVVANHPAVEKLTIVEINPGYLALLPDHPQVASVLTNPKVEVVIDDGRRWLSRHPERRFDLIVQNTTWHWRAHITNLLSAEYHALVRQRLAPGGLFYFNTTASDDAIFTAASGWPHALRFINFMAVSDAPIVLDRDRWRATLADYRIDGRAVLDLSQEEGRQRLESVLAMADTLDDRPTTYHGFETRESMLERLRTSRVITDDNMVTEWGNALRH